MSQVIFFGYGYTARHVSPLLRQQGFSLVGTRRGGQTDDDVSVLPFDDARPLPSDIVSSATGIVVSIAPDEHGCDRVLHHHGDVLAVSPHLRWVVYLSSSSVYGDHGGAWVSEDDELKATHDVGCRRIRAEQQWRDWHTGASHVSLIICRLAGIYGEGRSALESLKQGRARRIVKKGQWFGRIHVEDAASIIAAAITAMPTGCTIYNVCDDEPAPPQDVVTYAAQLLTMTPPPLEDIATARLSPMMASFYEGSKRLRNSKIKKNLGVSLRYPTYKDGLTALMREWSD